MYFLQILIKGQDVIIVFFLIIYCFEAICLIIFFLFSIFWCRFRFGIEGITNIMMEQLFLFEPLHLCYEPHNLA